MTQEQVAVASPSVAQLAQAATQQAAQQQQTTQQSQQSTQSQQQAQSPSTSQSASGQNLTQVVSGLIANLTTSATEGQRCLWEGCAERFGSAEELYEHICSQHIGRKSTNNLQLACRWSNCNITTVKRDHITSHVRVHVPFKPHRCPVCGKTFKRPQDLKKHHKTHADENSSGQNGHSHGPNGHSGSNGTNGYSSMNGNGGSFYGGAGMHNGVGINFPYNGQTGGGYYHQPAHMANSFGPVYYNVDAGNGPQVSYRRDDDLHTLNNIFGTIKQPNFNAASYPQFSSALTSAHGVILPPPVNTHGLDYSSAIDPTYPAHLPQLTNVRSKADLLLLQDRLQKMMHAIDAHDRSQAMAAHVGYHSQARQSLSATSEQTPDLTPSTSVMSYSPGHSPPADHSPISSTSMPSYPHLSSNVNMSAVPTLGTQYDHGIPHRHSGGRLQRAQPASAHEVVAEPSRPAGKTSRNEDPNIDPTLAGNAQSRSSSSSEGTPTPQPESPRDSVSDTDEQNVIKRDTRIVSELLNFVGSLIDEGKYEKSGSSSPAAESDGFGADTTTNDDAASTTSDSLSKMELDTKVEDNLYPSLPS